MTNERLIIREAIVRRCSVKKVFLKILQFHGETPVLESATLLKKRPQHTWFLVNIANCLRTSTLKNICELFKWVFNLKCPFNG